VPLPWRPSRSWVAPGGSGGGRWSLPGRGTASSLVLVMFGVGVLLLGASGCGSEGVARDATVHVYASAPLSGPEGVEGRAFCDGAEGVLRRAGGRAGDVHLRLTCLDDAGASRQSSTGVEAGESAWSLAAVGANARRASEDSAAVAYLGEPQAGAARFSLPILEAAGIGQVSGRTGAAAMAAVLKAVREAGGAENLRDDVAASLEAG
jgi:hypothetical protein